MQKNTFRIILLRKFAIILFTLNIVLGIIFGFVARNYHINKSLGTYEQKINNSTNSINNELLNIHNKIEVLSEIVLSQINYSRAFYDFNTMFKNVLSSEPNIESVFITLAPNMVLMSPEIYNYRDSIGRFNVTWVKSSKDIVFVDTVNYFENNYYYETVKNIPQTTIFDAKLIKNADEIHADKTVVIPLFDGTRFVGIMGYSINSTFLGDFLFKNDLSENTFIADETGILLFNRNKEITIGDDFNTSLKGGFEDRQTDVLHNKSFVHRSSKRILIFKSFSTLYENNWKIGTIISASEVYTKANIWFVVVLFAFVLFSASVLIVLNLVINRGLTYINLLLKRIGDLKNGIIRNEFVELDSFEELKELTRDIEDLRKRLVKLTKLHNQISGQNLDEYMESLSENDQLANSINSAITSIRERSVQREKALKIEKKNDWINEGLNLIHDAARVTDNSLEALTDKINEKISVFSDAFLSSIFIYFQEENQKPVLRAVSTFGLDKKRAFKREIEIGVGVVGSVAQERKTQYFDKIPDDYHIIVGGLSEMKPKSILIQTLEYEGDFYGIIEIAFLRKLEDFELEFFGAASSEIALSVKNLLNNLATNKLLERMKVQTTEIEKTQEMLQTKIKEISQKEKELLENQAVMQSMIKAVNNTLMTIEYTTKGILLTANDKYLNAMNYTLDELQGVNVLDLVKTERLELEDVIRKVANGESHEKIMKRFTKYGEVKWLYSTYTPYYDVRGNVTKVLYFAFDVTETKIYAEKLEKEISMLKKQVKVLREKL